MSRGGMVLGGVMTGEITYFGTNSLGLTVAAISSGMAIKAFIDAGTNLLMGPIIDRTHSKWGKARPYGLAAILMWLCTLAIFSVPASWFNGLEQDSKNMAIVVYITVFGTLASAVFGNLSGIAGDAHLKRSIVNTDNRIKVLTICGLVYALGTVVLQASLPTLIAAFHGAQSGFVLLAVVTSVMGIAGSIGGFLLCPEYTEKELDSYNGLEKEEKKAEVSIAVFLRSVLKNKYIILWTVISFLGSLNILGTFTAGQYYFQYFYGDLSAYTYVMISSAAAFPVMFLIPKLYKKFGIVKIITIFYVLAIFGIVVRLVMPHSFIAQCVGYVLNALPGIPTAFVGSQITIECMEYGRYKTGINAEARYSAFVGFAQKMAGAVSGLVIGAIMSITGFDYLTAAITGGFTDWAALAALGNAGFEQYITGGAATVAEAMIGLDIIYNYVPLTCMGLILLLLPFFKLEPDLKKLRVEHGLNEDGTRI